MYILAIIIFEFSVSKYIILVIFRNIYGVRHIFRNFCISKNVIPRKPLFVPLRFLWFLESGPQILSIWIFWRRSMVSANINVNVNVMQLYIYSTNIDGECKYEYHAIIHTWQFTPNQPSIFDQSPGLFLEFPYEGKSLSAYLEHRRPTSYLHKEILPRKKIRISVVGYSYLYCLYEICHLSKGK